MSKKKLRISIAILSGIIMIGAAFGLYKTEQSRIETESENNHYIYCAEKTISLANSLGISGEIPSSHATDTAGMSKMQSDLMWLAEYNTDFASLDRAYDELSTSPAAVSDGTYAQVCNTVMSYHQAEIDSENSNAEVKTIVYVAVFVVSLAALAYFAAVPERENEKH